MAFNAGGATSGAVSGATVGSAFGPWGTAIGGIAGGFLGGFGGGSADAQSGQAAANATNIALAERQMAFQRETLQNYHQWEVEDLKKAGLNPILSATHGSVGQPGSIAHVESDTKEKSNQQNAMKIALSEILSRTAVNTADALQKRSETKVNESMLPINAWNAKSAQANAAAAQANAVTAAANSAKAVQDAQVSTGKFGKAVAYVKKGLDPFRGIVGGGVSANYSHRSDN